ncbi:testican-2-like [Saccostrea cucullata]|uniref:testican-2-like n=1 Tax=Saccostrea cuccullata TaxID=36930 RepID=UPI002ED41C88
MDRRVILCFFVVCFMVLEAKRHEFESKKAHMWKKGLKGDADLKFKLFTRGSCVEKCKRNEVCVKEKGTDKSVCLARHIVRDSRRLLRKSRRLRNKNNHQLNRFQRFNKRQRHGLEYFEKKAKEFTKYQDKMNILKNKHARFSKPKRFEFSKDRALLEKMEDVKELMEHSHLSPVHGPSVREHVRQSPVHKPVCDKKDLHKMRGRLQGWFVTLHEEYHENKVNHKISKRSVGKDQSDGKCHCIKSVMWQFHQLDKNNDHHLDKYEMSEMEKNQKEACMRPFLKSCDTDGDSRLGKQEWCCCFQAEAPCHLAQKEAQEGKLLGATMPRCTVEGYYRRMQCNASTGYCWCADLNGNEIRGTRMSLKKGEPHCGKFDALGRVKTHQKRRKN